MLQKPEKTTAELTSLLLSLEDRLQLAALQERLSHPGKNALLALAGVDSTELGRSLALWAASQSCLDCKTHSLGSPEDFHAFIRNLQHLDPQKLHIVCLFEETMAPDKQVVAELVFNRDYIPQLCLKIIFILSHNLLNTIIEKAYDFYAIAGFSRFFNDFSQSSSKHFSSEISLKDVEFEEKYAELEQYRKQPEINDEELLNRLFRTAVIGWEVSRLNTALELQTEAWELAEKIGDDEYSSAISGNIGLIYQAKGDLDLALKYLRQALEIDREIGYQQGTATTLGNIGLIYQDKGDLDQAFKYLQQALEIARHAGFSQIIQGVEDSLRQINEIT